MHGFSIGDGKVQSFRFSPLRSKLILYQRNSRLTFGVVPLEHNLSRLHGFLNLRVHAHGSA